MGFRVEGLGFRAQGCGCRGEGSGVYFEVFPSADRRVAARGEEVGGLTIKLMEGGLTIKVDGFRFSSLVFGVSGLRAGGSMLSNRES